MSDDAELSSAAPRLTLVSAVTDDVETARHQAAFDRLKIHPNDAQILIRKTRYARQRFVPEGITWDGILLTDSVDKTIAKELGLPFETRRIDLPDEDEAKLWILERAMDIPDINTFQRIRIQLQRKALLASEGRLRMSAGGKGLTEMTNLPPHNSRRNIAKAANTSEGQLYKVECLLEMATAEMLAQLETGEIKIGAAFDALRTPENSDAPETRYNLLYLDLPTGIGSKRLRDLPLSELAADDAVLFCWSHPCDLATFMRLVRKAGFAYRTHFVLPLSKSVSGDFSQERHDVLIFATRGEIIEPALEDLPSTILPEASGPDRPESIFEMIETMFPAATRVQILSGSPRTGWAEWDFRGIANNNIDSAQSCNPDDCPK